MFLYSYTSDIRFVNCYKYSNTHNDPEINFSFGNGIHRNAIELPETFNANDLKYLSFYIIFKL